ncbi:MAG: hypothetical protein Q8P57_00505 [Candidatus Pacearchaeota archaeon]|nr:hypothetical protein [Candidatus Pacearchaeota archaeon]
MPEKFLKDLVSVISGQGTEKIVDVLYKKKNVNEFLIAKKLGITINQARNILYKLAEQGLVVFTRKKDKKSGGWYTYFWTLNEYKSLITLKERMLKDIEDLESELISKKSKQFYFCKYCGMEVSEENALLYDFTCPECGEVFEMKDSSGGIKKMESAVAVLRSKILLVEEEIDKIKNKEDFLKDKKIKLEAKEKAIKREEGRKKAAKERAKKAGVQKKTMKKAKTLRKGIKPTNKKKASGKKIKGIKPTNKKKASGKKQKGIKPMKSKSRILGKKSKLIKKKATKKIIRKVVLKR